MAELLFKNPQDYLQFEYDLRRARRPAYSMRAFARDLKMSASGLNDFMKARVGMSEGRIQFVSAHLHWTAERTEHFSDLLQTKFSRDKGARAAAAARVKARLKLGSSGLSLDEFKTISEWHHLVLLEICELKDHVDGKDLANDLNLPLARVTQALRRLQKLNLITETEKGLKPTESSSLFGDVGSSEAIRSFHSQLLERAQLALQVTPVQERDGQSMVFSIAKQDATKMTSEIRRAINSIVSRYAQTQDRDCIQALTLQVFPVWTDRKDSI